MDSLKLMTLLRSVLRATGLMPLAARVYGRFSGTQAYEEKFRDALLGAIRPGDCVWDVGANLGLYTKLFAERAGAKGRVVAFEPAPECFASMQESLAGQANVTLMNQALGDAEGQLGLSMAEDARGATHTFAPGASGARVVQVPVRRGDDVVAQGAPPPQVIKIDVEGFEEEVLAGLVKTLQRQDCRSVLIEVHFGLLEQRGKRQAPSRMVGQLGGYGYKVSWIDPSHLRATRA